MSVELHADDEAARSSGVLEAAPAPEPPDRERPNVSGDLPTVLEAAPMFRRAVVGYDRFQVETYVQWAEDEITAAERERRHLEARHVRTQAALEEAQRLLAHSSGGGEFLRLSDRIGSMLAAAADQAEDIRAEAEADRAAAAAEARRLGAEAEHLLTEARAEAERTVARGTSDAERLRAEASRIVVEAERTRRETRAQARARLRQVRAIEQRAAEQVEQIRQDALDEATAARLRARDEVVRMLDTAREQRRRADAGAAATRERLDREAAARYVSLLAEVEALEHRRTALRAEIELLSRPAAVPGSRLDVHLRRLQERLGRRPRSLRTP